jgi:hypothetical protein
MRTKTMKRSLCLALLLFPILAAASTQVEVGAPLPALTFKDQHDAPHALNAQTKAVIFSAERAVSSLVETVLEDQTTASLDAAGILYVADISAMPGIITTVIALPKMRKRPYAMLLGRTPEDTAMLPREAGKITLIESDAGTVTAIRFLPDAAALRSALGLAP